MANVTSDKCFRFRLPPEYSQDPDRFELWTVRVPVEVDLNDMEGCQLHYNDTTNPLDGPSTEQGDKSRFTSSSSSSNTIDDAEESSSIHNKTQTFSLQFGHGVENESLRLIIPKGQLDDDEEKEFEEDDQQDKNDTMVSLPKSFTRHINVVEYYPIRTEQQLAPHPDSAPTAQELRPAYAQVPQKAGLKRRWQPPGSQISLSLINEIQQTRVGSKNGSVGSLDMIKDDDDEDGTTREHERIGNEETEKRRLRDDDTVQENEAHASVEGGNGDTKTRNKVSSPLRDEHRPVTKKARKESRKQRNDTEREKEKSAKKAKKEANKKVKKDKKERKAKMEKTGVNKTEDR